MLLRALVTTCLLGTPPALAQDSSETAGFEEFQPMLELLDHERAPAQRWWWSWVGAYGGLTLGQGLVAVSSKDPDVRAAYGWGAAGSALGVGNLLVFPYPGRRGASRLRGLPVGTPAEREAALRSTEAAFEQTARSEASTRGFLAHAGGLVVSATTAGILWFHYDLRTDAVLNLVGGVVLTEAQVFSSPRRVHSAWSANNDVASRHIDCRIAVGSRRVWLVGSF